MFDVPAFHPEQDDRPSLHIGRLVPIAVHQAVVSKRTGTHRFLNDIGTLAVVECNLAGDEVLVHSCKQHALSRFLLDSLLHEADLMAERVPSDGKRADVPEMTDKWQPDDHVVEKNRVNRQRFYTAC